MGSKVNTHSIVPDENPVCCSGLAADVNHYSRDVVGNVEDDSCMSEVVQ